MSKKKIDENVRKKALELIEQMIREEEKVRNESDGNSEKEGQFNAEVSLAIQEKSNSLDAGEKKL